MNNPQSELAKSFSVAIQGLQSATLRNDGPCQTLAAEKLNSLLSQVDELVAELETLKNPPATDA